MEIEEQILQRKEVYNQIKLIKNADDKKEQYKIFRSFGVMHNFGQKIDNELFLTCIKNAKNQIKNYLQASAASAAI